MYLTGKLLGGSKLTLNFADEESGRQTIHYQNKNKLKNEATGRWFFIGVILSVYHPFCAFVRRLNRSCTGKSHHLSLPPMSIQQENRFQAIIAHAKEYGFYFQAVRYMMA